MIRDVETLLALRDGSPQGEAAYRSTVLGLLGAFPLQGLGPVVGRTVRRAEGVARMPHTGHDGTDTVALVMFAVGNNGAGSVPDIRSKHGEVCARSLLRPEHGADIVVVVTTILPEDRMREEAARCGEIVIPRPVPGADDVQVQVPRCWIMDIAEVVDRAEEFLALRKRADRPWWARLLRLPAPEAPPMPVSPLLVGRQVAHV